MTDTGAVTGLEELPSILPIFPLTGALLLTAGQLPLNIFEPRYLAMVSDAMATHRLIGMVQPRDPESSDRGRRAAAEASKSRDGKLGRGATVRTVGSGSGPRTR